MKEESEKTVYMLGPITNTPENNYRRFASVQEELEKTFKTVVNPYQKFEEQEIRNMHDLQLLSFEVRELLVCDEVITLTGWEDNLCAQQVAKIARILCKPIIPMSKIITTDLTHD